MNLLNYGKNKPVKDSFQAFLVEDANFTAIEEYPMIATDMIARTVDKTKNTN